MKRILFLTLLSCVGLCAHAMAGTENKNECDEKEKRSISHDPVKVEMSYADIGRHIQKQ